jgi:hypothetical protein
MLKLPKKIMIVLAAVVGVELIALGAAYGLVIAPQKQRAMDIDQQLIEREKELDLASVDAQPETQQRLNEQYEAIQASLARFAIRPEARTATLAQIDALSEEAGLSDFSRRARPTPAAAGNQGSISQDMIDVTFVATFNQLASFVSLLEGNSPVIFVDRLSVNRTNSGDEHIVSMVLMILVRDEAPEIQPAVEGESDGQ